MKIIDLLVKIANGEEVPKKIKWGRKIFEYNENFKDIHKYIDEDNYKFLSDHDVNFSDEVEIIEENKIEKLDKSITDNVASSVDMRIISNKINEIIDKINKIGE